MFIKEGYYPCQTIEDEQDVLLVGAADLAYMDVYREDDLRAAVSFVIFEYPSMKVFQLANNLLIASFSSSEVSDVWRRKYRSILKTLFFRNRPYFLLHFSTSNHTWNGVWFLKATFRIIWQLEKLNLSRNLFGRMTFHFFLPSNFSIPERRCLELIRPDLMWFCAMEMALGTREVRLFRF